jgi:opacity protein-like surface antigen
MKRLLATAALATLVGVAAAQAPAVTPAASVAPAARSLNVAYTISGKGIEAGEFLYGVKFENGAYEATARRRMTGLIGALVGNAQNYSYSARGRVTAHGLDPEAYRHQGGKRNRVVTVDFTGANPVTTSNPVMGMGNPPATATQKIGTVDQVTAIASLIAANGDPCNRTVRVLMDGRSRFDFVLAPAGRENVHTRAWRGSAIRCSVQFRPIAGFPDPQTPATLEFLFAPTPNGLYAPLRIEMPTDIEQIGVAVLEAKSFTAS